eukprot:8096399-Lingulodinium_polyedra.AAC.1
MKRAFEFLGAETTLLSVSLGVLATAPVQHMLHTIFHWEKLHHKHYSSNAEKLREKRRRKGQACGSISVPPVGLRLAEGKAVDQCLVEGASIVAPESGPEWARRLQPPLYVAAFRTLLTPRNQAGGTCPETVQAMWAVLLPGLAQMWFRVKVTWQSQWPYRLLQLLRAELSFDAKRKVAEEFLAAQSCCLAQGGGISKAAREAALRWSTNQTEQIEFLLGKWTTELLQAWCESISPSIADLECINAKVKRWHTGGRAPKVSTVAAKGLISEAIASFEGVSDTAVST